ncbi:MAG TPA: hypothetical protein VFM48_01285, partial [Aquabacterium sp.]|nr:hypothetical protein [Aquabacterium sp.]
MTHSSAPTMRQVVLHSCVTVLALMLSACGGGSGIAIPTQQGSSLPTSTSAPNATAQVFNAADYIFPYQVGDHRVFIDLDPRNPDSALYPSFMDIKSSATVDGQTGWVVSATGPATYFVAINSDTIRTFGMRTDIGELSRPLETYPTVLHLGDQFVVNRLSWTETDQLSGNQVEATLTTISTVVSVEDITTRL